MLNLGGKMNLLALELSAKANILLANKILKKALENDNFSEEISKEYYMAMGKFWAFSEAILYNNVEYYSAVIAQCRYYLDLHEEIIKVFNKN